VYTKQTFLIAALGFYSFSSFSQTLNYDLVLLGKKIGRTTVEKKDSAGLTQYKLKSQSDARFLGMDKKDNMSTEAIFNKDGKMLASDFKNKKNKHRLTTQAVWRENKLDINIDGKVSSTAEAVNFSSLSLYFTEPKDHQRMFSERLGKFVEIIKESENKFKVSFGDYTGIYTYAEGKLKELQMKDDGGQVVMKLVE
jgi:hypothetical protein